MLKRVYHIAGGVRWLSDLDPAERSRIEQTVLSAIERALRGNAQRSSATELTEDSTPDIASERYKFSHGQSATDAYAVPSYQAHGEPVLIPVVPPAAAGGSPPTHPIDPQEAPTRSRRQAAPTVSSYARSNAASPAVAPSPHLSSEEADWHEQLDEMLPPGVGFLTHIDRVRGLLDIFGADLLPQHVYLVHANPAATQFVRETGNPGLVALYDTRQGNDLDLPAARHFLEVLPDRYSRSSLSRLRFVENYEPIPTYWFHELQSQRPESVDTNSPVTRAQRDQVFVEQMLSRVGGRLFVRFAYSATEISSGRPSARVQTAKTAILNALAQLVADLNSQPPAHDAQERLNQQILRARLLEALDCHDASSPLNIYIATELSSDELLSGQLSVLTDRIYIRAADAGNMRSLEAAMRIPLTFLHGGLLPQQGGLQHVPAASPAEIKRTLLHESLHALLVRESSDGNGIWDSISSHLTIHAGTLLRERFVELVRKFLIAQEESFVYEFEGSLYPPISQYKAAYDRFVHEVDRFLRDLQVTEETVSREIPVRRRAGRQRVSWTIMYRVPRATITLTPSDFQILELLIQAYPLR